MRLICAQPPRENHQSVLSLSSHVNGQELPTHPCQQSREQAAPGSQKEGCRQGQRGSHAALHRAPEPHPALPRSEGLVSSSPCSKPGWLQTCDVQAVRGMNWERHSPGMWAGEQGCPSQRHSPNLPWGERREEGKQLFAARALQSFPVYSPVQLLPCSRRPAALMGHS